MASASNPVMAPAVTYEYLLCLMSSDQLRPLARWKGVGLLLRSSTPGTAGHRLRPNILDMTSSL
jgi:hypothetical protein